MTVEFICEQLADMFGAPCNLSPMDEILCGTEYCENNCGEVKDSECWAVYFGLIADMRGEE